MLSHLAHEQMARRMNEACAFCQDASTLVFFFFSSTSSLISSWSLNFEKKKKLKSKAISRCAFELKRTCVKSRVFTHAQSRSRHLDVREGGGSVTSEMGVVGRGDL